MKSLTLHAFHERKIFPLSSFSLTWGGALRLPNLSPPGLFFLSWSRTWWLRRHPRSAFPGSDSSCRSGSPFLGCLSGRRIWSSWEVSAAVCWLVDQLPSVSSSPWTPLGSLASSFRRLGRYRRSFLLRWLVFSCCAVLPAWRPFPSLLRWFWFPPLCPQGGLWRRSSAALPPTVRSSRWSFGPFPRTWAASVRLSRFSRRLFPAACWLAVTCSLHLIFSSPWPSLCIAPISWPGSCCGAGVLQRLHASPWSAAWQLRSVLCWSFCWGQGRRLVPSFRCHRLALLCRVSAELYRVPVRFPPLIFSLSHFPPPFSSSSFLSFYPAVSLLALVSWVAAGLPLPSWWVVSILVTTFSLSAAIHLAGTLGVPVAYCFFHADSKFSGVLFFASTPALSPASYRLPRSDGKSSGMSLCRHRH